MLYCGKWGSVGYGQGCRRVSQVGTNGEGEEEGEGKKGREGGQGREEVGYCRFFGGVSENWLS